MSTGETRLFWNLPYVPYVLYVESAVSLKWHVGFENDMKITTIFTITFLDDGLYDFDTRLMHTF